MSLRFDELRRCLEVLELTPGASWTEVRSRYRFLAKVWHPDRFAHDDSTRSEAEDRFKKVNEAYHWVAANRHLLGSVPAPGAPPRAEPSGRTHAPGVSGPRTRHRSGHRPPPPGAEPDPLRWLWRLGGVCLLLVVFALATSAVQTPSADSELPGPEAATVDAEPADSSAALRTKPNLSAMSPEERLAVESACEPSRLAFGEAAYFGCLGVQVDRLAASEGAPDLSGLTGKERLGAEHRCEFIKLAFGPATYYDCLRDQLRGRTETR